MEFLPGIPKMGARVWDEAPDYNIPGSLYKGVLGSWGDAFNQTFQAFWIRRVPAS